MDNDIIYFIVHFIGGMLLVGFAAIMGVTIFKEIKKGLSAHLIDPENPNAAFEPPRNKLEL